MLRCKDVFDRASALIDEEISPWEGLQMQMHLALCKGCRRFIEQMRQTDRITSEVAPQVAQYSGNVEHNAPNGQLAAVLSTPHDEKQFGR